jgi:hypothetical protein
MNCPHCQKELPVNYEGASCPACGNGLPLPPDAAQSPDPSQKISWPFFFAWLFAPVLLTTLAARFPSQANDLAVLTVLLGGPISGGVCGVMLSRRLGHTTESRVLIGMLLVPAMMVVCVVMNFYGCVAGSQGLNFH